MYSRSWSEKIITGKFENSKDWLRSGFQASENITGYHNHCPDSPWLYSALHTQTPVSPSHCPDDMLTEVEFLRWNPMAVYRIPHMVLQQTTYIINIFSYSQWLRTIQYTDIIDKIQHINLKFIVNLLCDVYFIHASYLDFSEKPCWRQRTPLQDLCEFMRFPLINLITVI